uniref:Uncharacterized protein n=1 Tax=Avena sativa TaxID=4498 RepID=A0ACD5Z8D1_AVESA
MCNKIVSPILFHVYKNTMHFFSDVRPQFYVKSKPLTICHAVFSADGDNTTVNKGITHGACGYLVKPVRITELRNIWQHVIRKNLGAMSNNNRDNDDPDQRVVPPVIVLGERGGAKGKKCSKKNKNDGHGSDENKETMHVHTTQRKPRVSWTGELQRRFMKVVNRLGGADKAYPKTILQMMEVDDLTRGSVASHLQNYRMNLKKAADDRRKSSLLSESSARRKSSSGMNINHQGSLSDHHEHHRGPHGVPIQSRNWAMGPVGHGCSTQRITVPCVPDTARLHASGPPVKSLANISDHTMLDAFSSSHSDKECANFVREKLLEARNVAPSSHPAGNYFITMPNRGMLEHVNQFQVKPLELPCKQSMVGECHDAQFPCHVGTSSKPWPNFASSNYPGSADGAPLFTSSQVSGFEASPGKVPTFQDEQQNHQMVGSINNTTPLARFSEQMAPFNMESNTTTVELTSVNFSPITQMVNCGSTSSLLPNLQMVSSVAPLTQMVNGRSISFALPGLQDNSVTPAQMLNGGDASVILHGLVDQEAPEDQPNYNNTFLQDAFFSTMHNQDFSHDVFFGGEH